MNTKTITYTDPATGEILTGTINDIATKCGISRMTLNRRINAEKHSDSNVTSNVTEEEPKPNVTSVSNVTLPTVTSNVTPPRIRVTSQEDPFDLPIKTKPQPTTTVASGTCEICNKKTFYHIDSHWFHPGNCRDIFYQKNPHVKREMFGKNLDM